MIQISCRYFPAFQAPGRCSVWKIGFHCLLFLTATLSLSNELMAQTSPKLDDSVARMWNEAIIEAMRTDIPSAKINARNLFHLSLAMYDAWAVYHPVASGLVVTEKVVVEESQRAVAINEAVSYAAYRFLDNRYEKAFRADENRQSFSDLMQTLGYDPTQTSAIGDNPHAVGNRVATAILEYAENDNSNEENNYADTSGYEPVNPGMIFVVAGTTMNDPNHWQPLVFPQSILSDFTDVESQRKAGIDGDSLLEQIYFEPHWGEVRPFSLSSSNRTSEGLYFDPGPPPYLGGVGDEDFKDNIVEIIRLNSLLFPKSPELIDISPGSLGNNQLGTDDGKGHTINPKTGDKYAANPVKIGDYGRVSAMYWSDGPNSETPPGHWNVIANAVSDHPLLPRRIGGGLHPQVDRLEWDIKMYLALNGALHDAAIAAFGIKTHYDYVRPISMIRYMATQGQSSEPEASDYHPEGLPLIPGLIERITEASSAAGERHEHLQPFIGDIAALGWHHSSPHIVFSAPKGVQWILGRWWMPYQEADFVTPSFAAYVSGHSTLSRAAAEVMTKLTGDAFFPGGLFEIEVEPDFLAENFPDLGESGPSDSLTLQWATYYDAADAAGRSRLWGGIHVNPDDVKGRIVGSEVGQYVWDKVDYYYSGKKIWDTTRAGRSLGQGWINSPWLGLVYTAESPWTYHPQFGWIYLHGHSFDSIWIWSSYLGWFWTSDTDFPYIWRAQNQSWYYLFAQENSTDPWFYSFSASEWVQF